ERALSVAPKEIAPEIRTELAAVLFGLGHSARAREVVTLAIENARDSFVFADALFRLGQILLHESETAAAREALEKALEHDRFAGRRRRIARSLELLAEVARREGRLDDAKELEQRRQAVLASLEDEEHGTSPETDTAPGQEPQLSRSSPR
ncbi:MAG TPA: tetratricopeptide repeat protein, partial [Planctomycetota bacterium]|nr:tetratricopeptide repeat protein [Planctomycetota bacterium]